jgi:hypothetical protein
MQQHFQRFAAMLEALTRRSLTDRSLSPSVDVRNAPMSAIFIDIINALAGMEYPHWLLLAGSFLMFVGCGGMAMHRKDVETGFDPIVSEQEASRPEDDLGEPEVIDPLAKEKRRDRSADREIVISEPPEVGPEFYGKRSK